MAKLDPRGPKPISQLNPVVDGVRYALVFQELAAIPKSALGERVVSLAVRRVELIAALDLLLTGV